MRITTREVRGKLLVDMNGPFPHDTNDMNETAATFCDAIGGRDDFILVFHDVGCLKSADVGVLHRFLKQAGVQFSALGVGPIVSIVTSDRRTHAIFNIVDSSFAVYDTEEEALSPGKSSGCLGVAGLLVAAVTLLVVAV